MLAKTVVSFLCGLVPLPLLNQTLSLLLTGFFFFFSKHRRFLLTLALSLSVDCTKTPGSALFYAALWEEIGAGVLVVFTASQHWRRSSLSSSSLEPVRCSIAALSRRDQSDIVEPHTLAAGPLLPRWRGSTWAAMHFGLDQPLALAAHQRLCCSAALQPASCSLPKPIPPPPPPPRFPEPPQLPRGVQG